MYLTVRQKKLSLSDAYKIELNGQVHFTAVSKLFSALSEITLNPIDTNRLTTKIERIWSLFKIKYRIQIGDFNSFIFESVSIFNIHFGCLVGSDTYSIYGHKKRSYSIFKNGIQVASINQKLVTIIEGDEYIIEANDDCYIELILAICLILDDYYSDQDTLIRFNFMQFAWGMRKKDENWKSNS